MPDRQQASVLHQLRNLASLMHLGNGIASGFGAVIGYFLTRQRYGDSVDWGVALAVFAVTACISSAGFIINDIRDLDIDRINRPDRPLPANLFSLRQAWVILLLFTVGGIVLSAIINLTSLLVVVFLCVLLAGYSLYLKPRFLVGHIAIALAGALLLPYGGIAAGNIVPTIYVVPIAFTAFLGREILKTLPDVAGDAAHQVTNLATRLGVRTAASAAFVCIAGAGVLLAVLPVFWQMNGLYFPTLLLIVYPVMVYLLVLISNYTSAMNQAIRLSKLVFLLVLLPITIGSFIMI
ncbi:MAG: UbiA family prenyltransferase [Anaerolineaceae bacterium]|nr:UbiA family prenyltransferase [Anaerolineaceae bacterium]